MNREIVDFDKLVKEGKNYLLNTLRYRAKTSNNYQRHWRHIALYMKSRKIFKVIIVNAINAFHCIEVRNCAIIDFFPVLKNNAGDR